MERPGEMPSGGWSASKEATQYGRHMSSEGNGDGDQDLDAEQESGTFAWEQLLSGLMVGAGLLISSYGVYATIRVRSLVSDFTNGISPGSAGPMDDMQIVAYTAQMLMLVALGLGVVALGFIWRRLTS